MDGPIVVLLVADCGRNCHLGHNGGSATTHDILIQQQYASPCSSRRNGSIHAGSARSDDQDISRYVLHVDLSHVISSFLEQVFGRAHSAPRRGGVDALSKAKAQTGWSDRRKHFAELTIN